MDAILAFFSDLVLFTAGLVVCILWIVALVVVGIEIWDLITGNDGKDKEDQDV